MQAKHVKRQAIEISLEDYLPCIHIMLYVCVYLCSMIHQHLHYFYHQTRKLQICLINTTASFPIIT